MQRRGRLFQQAHQDGSAPQHLLPVGGAQGEAALVGEDQDRGDLGQHQGDEQQGDQLPGKTAGKEAHYPSSATLAVKR